VQKLQRSMAFDCGYSLELQVVLFGGLKKGIFGQTLNRISRL